VISGVKLNAFVMMLHAFLRNVVGIARNTCEYLEENNVRQTTDIEEKTDMIVKTGIFPIQI
jgi:hypothetical protein